MRDSGDALDRRRTWRSRPSATARGRGPRSRRPNRRRRSAPDLALSTSSRVMRPLRPVPLTRRQIDAELARAGAHRGARVRHRRRRRAEPSSPARRTRAPAARGLLRVVGDGLRVGVALGGDLRVLAGGLGPAARRRPPSSVSSSAPSDTRSPGETLTSAIVARERRRDVHRRLVGLERDERVLGRDDVAGRDEDLDHRHVGEVPDVGNEYLAQVPVAALKPSSGRACRGRCRTSRSPWRPRRRRPCRRRQLVQRGERDVMAVDLEEAPQHAAEVAAPVAVGAEHAVAAAGDERPDPVGEGLHVVARRDDRPVVPVERGLDPRARAAPAPDGACSSGRRRSRRGAAR